MFEFSFKIFLETSLAQWFLKSSRLSSGHSTATMTVLLLVFWVPVSGPAGKAFIAVWLL